MLSFGLEGLSGAFFSFLAQDGGSRFLFFPSEGVFWGVSCCLGLLLAVRFHYLLEPMCMVRSKGFF